MTYEEFIELIKQPEKVTEANISDLKEMIVLYPYFLPARLFLLKSMQLSNNMHFAAELKTTSIYCSNRRWLYYYLHPEKILSAEPYRRDKVGKSVGDYFGMMDAIESEGGDTKKSLKSLAQGLKSAREMLITTPKKSVPEPVTLKPQNTDEIKKEETKTSINSQIEYLNNADYFEDSRLEISEINYKNLISQKRYKEAIVILGQLNLNNPKKSVYFADQIRFLEKVLENSKRKL